MRCVRLACPWSTEHEFCADHAAESLRGARDPDWPELEETFVMTAGEIKSLWAQQAAEAAQLGTEMHVRCELILNGCRACADVEEMRLFAKFLEQGAKLLAFRTEWAIFADEEDLAGTIDFAAINESGQLVLFDWKRTKDLQQKFNSEWRRMQPPLERLADCAGQRYYLQLNCYKFILQKYYDVEVAAMYVVGLHPDCAPSPRVKEVPEMSAEIQSLLRACSVGLAPVGSETLSLPKDALLRARKFLGPRPAGASATSPRAMWLARAQVFDLLLRELLELLDGRATLRLLALCRDARRPEWAERGAAARRLAEDFAAFLQGARVRLPGFQWQDVLEVRACWKIDTEWENCFRPPAFLAGAFCAGSQCQMRRWIDRFWRIRGLGPIEALRRLNLFFDSLKMPELEFYLGLLRKGQACFFYSPKIDRPGDFRACFADDEEGEVEPPVDAGLAIVLRCDHFAVAICARQARPARSQ
ncbi:unnamed protein product [Effrenium voratum]|nr:unnamed protein product [Effrenium voratum]